MKSPARTANGKWASISSSYPMPTPTRNTASSAKRRRPDGTTSCTGGSPSASRKLPAALRNVAASSAARRRRSRHANSADDVFRSPRPPRCADPESTTSPRPEGKAPRRCAEPETQSEQRQVALEVAAERLGQARVDAVHPDQHTHENPVCETGEQKDDAVRRDRPGGEVRLAHPACHERRQRQPEKQVQVRPQDAAADA